MTQRDLELGTVVGSYRLTEEIGRGATGVVYRAEGEGRTVAVKVLHDELAEEDEVRSRFEREAFATSRITHPCCVTTHDIGITEDGRLYLIMEYVEGESLADLLDREERLPPARALSIARDIAAGLEHAHAAEVVHRDIKPANILITRKEDGGERAKILDFGLAKLIGGAAIGSEKLTRAGMAIGTPRYMAPEWLGSADIGPAADIYATAILIYEMLTGAPPFSGDDPLDVLKHHAMQEVPPIAQRVPDAPVSRDIEDLVMRGLAKDPAKRQGSAKELRAAIEEALEGIGNANETLLMTALPVPKPAAQTPATPEPEPKPEPEPLATTPVADVLPAPVRGPLPDLPTPREAHAVAAPAPASPSVASRARQTVVSAARRVRRSRRLSWGLAGVGAVLLIGIIAAASGGNDASAGGVSAGLGVETGASKPAGAVDIDDAVDAWNDADLDAGGFAAHSGKKLGATGCQSGAVSGLDVTVCSYPDPEAAQKAEVKGRADIGSHTGAAVAIGPNLLIVADRKGTDPTGKSINTLINTFRKQAVR